MFLQKHTSLPYWSLILAKIDIASISKIVGYRILHNLICHLQKMIINSIIYIKTHFFCIDRLIYHTLQIWYACKNNFHSYMLKYAIMWVSKRWDYGLRFEPSVIATVARTVSCDFFSGKQNKQITSSFVSLFCSSQFEGIW